MTQADYLHSKGTTSADPPSTPPQISVPPPYETTWDDTTFNTRPGNHFMTRTSTGNITLGVNGAPDTPLVLSANSTWDAIRVSLPRTFHGPLTLSSTARLSGALRRAATPLREEYGTTHWFVGDVAAWSARDEVGDAVQVRSVLGGRVWVGFVGDEPVQARGVVLKGGVKQVGPNRPIALLWALYWALVAVGGCIILVRSTT
ncbi:hypothetical protein C8R46DRAFT_1272131 [Mycena filopes]|nr:hypothetical protein C8R46DRAFT_1272131 [Mycena filopes]